MAPTIVRDGQFRLFFFSREEARIHVHVAHPDGEAKFWLTPEIAVATTTGLSPRQLREAQAVVRARPATAKGRYLEAMTLSATMSPGIHVDPSPYLSV